MGRRTRQQPPRDERPPAPWGSFPLSELMILIGVVLIVWGVLSGRDGQDRFIAGLAVASLGGAELALREHLAGYRSHSTLLAGGGAVVAGAAPPPPPRPGQGLVLPLLRGAAFRRPLF